MSAQDWEKKLLSEIFDELKGMNLRQLARALKVIRDVKATTNERGI